MSKASGTRPRKEKVMPDEKVKIVMNCSVTNIAGGFFLKSEELPEKAFRIANMLIQKHNSIIELIKIIWHHRSGARGKNYVCPTYDIILNFKKFLEWNSYLNSKEIILRVAWAIDENLIEQSMPTKTEYLIKEGSIIETFNIFSEIILKEQASLRSGLLRITERIST
jgi:hypothetical protein